MEQVRHFQWPETPPLNTNRYSIFIEEYPIFFQCSSSRKVASSTGNQFSLLHRENQSTTVVDDTLHVVVNKLNFSRFHKNIYSNRWRLSMENISIQPKFTSSVHFFWNFFDKLVGKFFCSLTSEVIRSSYGEHRRCYIVEPKLAKPTNQTNYASRSY